MTAFLALLLALAQDAAPQKYSISGSAREFGSDSPIADADVYIDRAPARRVEARTNLQGNFTVPDLEPGRYRVTVQPTGRDGTRGFTQAVMKLIVLGSRDLTGVDFKIKLPGAISGTITDQNSEPVPEVSVFLVAREYALGELRYVFAGSVKTDDAGQYTIRSVAPGRAYLVYATRRDGVLHAVSSAPDNIKLRRPAVVPTYYPGTPNIEGAQAITLGSSEHREGIDIRLERSPAFCAAGVIDRAGAPGTLRFQIAERQPTSGASGGSSTFIFPSGGTPEPDGKFRICDLAPGEYRLTATQDVKAGAPPFVGSIPLMVTDRDLHQVSIAPRQNIAMRGEVVWSGDPPSQEVPRIRADLMPLTRSLNTGEHLSISLPEETSWDALIMDDYGVLIRALPRGAYLKDVLYGGHSILNQPLHAGSASDSSLRVVLSADGGTINAKAADKDGNALPDQHVLILPESASTQAALAAAMISVQTDQNGACTSPPLAPGKYYVLAVSEPIDKSPESIAKIWNSRSGAQKVDVAPKSAVQVSLAP